MKKGENRLLTRAARKRLCLFVMSCRFPIVRERRKDLFSNVLSQHRGPVRLQHGTARLRVCETPVAPRNRNGDQSRDESRLSRLKPAPRMLKSNKLEFPTIHNTG